MPTGASPRALRGPSPASRAGWILDTLGVTPGEHILELGCGSGTTLWHVGARLGRRGRVDAIDRSLTMAKRAAARNIEHIEAGRVVVHHTDLASFSRPGRRFDKVFAVNLGLFWSGPSAQEWAVVRRILGGGLYLFFHAATADRTGKICERAAAVLREAGFRHTLTVAPSGRLCCLLGRTGVSASRR